MYLVAKCLVKNSCDSSLIVLVQEEIIVIQNVDSSYIAAWQ